ncbi:hypothetical protein D7D52_36015 [Nocardia yunnanensis]|uniref:Uncharacterized protein n=1 Tax=Nocardia yunnanensis TaxID=2382165 RepID=A0A386ZLL4_9NOCA|nr:hypothetical protein [Nocardia yunnanensis]AYF78346.1 hypothetical protein D7D52_36015 [Nocardia yunnanensis]
MSDNTFHAQAAGLAEVTLRIRGRGPGDSVLVIADPAADHATVTLRPVQPGDLVAQAQIDAAEVSGHGTRLQVVIPKPTTPAARITESGGVSITAGTVIAANIGGQNNTGTVNFNLRPPRGNGVFAVVTVPLRPEGPSTVNVVADEAPVTVRGTVAGVFDTAGIVRLEWDTTSQQNFGGAR